MATVRKKTATQRKAQYERIKDALEKSTKVDNYMTRKNGWSDMVGNDFEQTFQKNRNGKAQYSPNSAAASKRAESALIAARERNRLSAMADRAYNNMSKAAGGKG